MRAFTKHCTIGHLHITVKKQYYHERTICMTSQLRWGEVHCIFETTDYSASTALSLEWIFANTKK